MKPKEFEEQIERLERSGFPIDKSFAKAIKKLMKSNEARKDMIRELVSWAESVEGQHVSRGITRGPDSIFVAAKKLIKE